MKPTVTILVCVLAAGLASAQSPSIIQNTRNTMNGVSENATAASNQALGIQQSAPARAPRSNGAAVVMPAKSSGAAPVPPQDKARARRVPAVAGAAVVQPTIVVSKSHAPTGAVVAAAAGSGDGENEQQVVPDAKYNANGRRDPFVSPVVSKAAGGSGCSSGKKCLEIGEINLRGVVHGEAGFIAVVSNGLNKAYFLRENDPVFNGYVMKITGDSIVFQETLQDRLGKSFTREVVKKITTPAV
jgi:hypothetical protein